MGGDRAAAAAGGGRAPAADRSRLVVENVACRFRTGSSWNVATVDRYVDGTTQAKGVPLRT